MMPSTSRGVRPASASARSIACAPICFVVRPDAFVWSASPTPAIATSPETSSRSDGNPQSAVIGHGVPPSLTMMKVRSQREEVDLLPVDEPEVHDARPERAHHLVLPTREGLLEVAHHLGMGRREIPALALVGREVEAHRAAAHLVLHE